MIIEATLLLNYPNIYTSTRSVCAKTNSVQKIQLYHHPSIPYVHKYVQISSHHIQKHKRQRKREKKENIASHADHDIEVDQSFFIRGFVQVISLH
jgi:hypothetical protein